MNCDEIDSNGEVVTKKNIKMWDGENNLRFKQLRDKYRYRTVMFAYA